MSYNLAAPEHLSPPTGGPPWLDDLRRRNLDGFRQLGLPTQKVEAWKFTNLNSLRRIDFADPAEAARTQAVPAALTEAKHRLVFVDGDFDARASTIGALPDGIVLESLSRALADSPELLRPHLSEDKMLSALPFPALNGGMATDGYVLRLADDVVVDGLIEISFVAGGGARVCHPRNLIIAGAGAKANILQSHMSAGGQDYLSNSLTTLALGPAARIGFYRLQDEAGSAHHISTVTVDLAEQAELENFTLSLGAKLSRNEIHLSLNGPGAAGRIDGAYLLAENQHGDNTSFIDHRAADTSSSETYKGVLDDKAQAVFAGRIKVHPDAQRIDGQQLSRALLLSDSATINTKPELEIYADDVKCSHGATVGELSEDGLFYLRSRGIPELRARHLLIEAFVGEVIDGIAVSEVRAALMIRVAAWLEAHSR